MLKKCNVLFFIDICNIIVYVMLCMYMMVSSMFLIIIEVFQK